MAKSTTGYQVVAAVVDRQVLMIGGYMQVILVVDDSPSVLHMLTAVLTSKGFEVITAASGCEALQIMDGRRIDLVVTDLLMPEMDGIDLIREIRKDTGYGKIPILMLTTQSNEEMRKKGKAAGATGWITKPFSWDGLAALIRKTIGSR